MRSFKEVMKALIDGKKLRRRGWEKSSFIYLDEEGNLRYENGEEYDGEISGDACEFEEFKIVEEPGKVVYKYLSKK